MHDIQQCQVVLPDGVQQELLPLSDKGAHKGLGTVDLGIKLRSVACKVKAMDSNTLAGFHIQIACRTAVAMGLGQPPAHLQARRLISG